jgi:hypothetical protein
MNAPLLLAILMAMAVCWSKTDGIAQCGMSRATPGSHWTPPSGDYSLRIAPAAARVTANDTTTKKWTNFDGHFDGGGDAPEQYRSHCLMEEV